MPALAETDKAPDVGRILSAAVGAGIRVFVNPAPAFRDRPGPLRFGLALLAVCWAAKTAVVVRQASMDGMNGRDVGAVLWWVCALGFEDIWLAAGLAATLALAGAALRRRPRARGVVARAGAITYALLAGWAAINVPVMAELSSPLTLGFLHAASPALGDSFARSVNLFTIGAPLALGGLAAALPRWLPRQIPTRARPAAAVVLAAVGAVALLGPRALARAETRGLHKSAVLSVVGTTWRRHRATGDPDRLDRTLPGCAASLGAPGEDLRALGGLARGRNILWVVLESTGARALPAYGGARDMTPNLSALARDAILWERAYAAYPESIKGLFSMLCSRVPPPDSEAADYGSGRLPCAPVAEVFTRAGYATALFHSGRFDYLGMDAVVAGRGFATLRDAGSIPSRFTSSFGVDDRATADALLGWIDARPPGRPFFAVYMPIAGHHPYHAPGDTPRPLPERTLRDEYLNDLFVGDQAFGHLRAGLAARGLDDDTVYIVVGDHGEAFREHPGNVAHALFLYEENVHVPFFVAAPGRLRGLRRAPQVVSLVDLAPTTLALAGLPGSADHEGSSALDAQPRVARFFTEQASRRAGLVDGSLKLVVDLDGGRRQLFELAHDAGERHPLPDADADRLARYDDCLRWPPPRSRKSWALSWTRSDVVRSPSRPGTSTSTSRRRP